MQDFKKLKVWEKSHKLTLRVYKTTSSFPPQEMYGLVSQMRRASSSIAANIAEGCGRDGNAELARFLGIAIGSASELEYHLILARDLSMVGNEDYDQLDNDTTEVKRMLTSLVQRPQIQSLTTDH